MLQKIDIKGFKSIEQASINLGKLNIFIGTNASGKSNLFDAFKFLQGVGYCFTIDEILNGRAKSASSIEWEGIRGGSENVLFKQGKNISSFELYVKLKDKEILTGYSIEAAPKNNKIISEKLVYTADVDEGQKPTRMVATSRTFINAGKKEHPPVDEQTLREQAVVGLSNEDTDEKRESTITFLISFLSDQQRLDIVPSVLREYSRQSSATRIGEKGENFASVVKNIMSDPKAGKEYLNWLRKLTPNEIDEIEIGRGAVNDLIFGIKENGNITYAPSLSDGTLRFAAITAALFQPSPPKMLLIEEIENGIHPTRMRLLMELLMNRAEHGGSQIFITTHSPVLLDWINEKYFDNVFFCARKENGATVITL